MALDVLPIVKKLYAKPDGLAGGTAHIVLDDGNLEDDDIRYCLQETFKEQLHPQMDISEQTLVLCHLILTAMQTMTITQRRKLYALR